MAIKIAEEVLEKKIGSSSSEETMEVGGLNYIADVMNHVDRSTERDIFDELNMKKSAAGRGRAQAHVCIRGHRLSGPSVRTAVPA